MKKWIALALILGVVSGVEAEEKKKASGKTFTQWEKDEIKRRKKNDLPKLDDKALIELFAKLDKNGDGKLSKKEKKANK